MSAQLRLGMVGAGAIAQAYVQAARDIADVRWVGIADHRGSAARATAAQAGCSAYSETAELLTAARPDAVLVTTPPSQHEPVCAELLDAGVSVLCEKPLTPDVDSATRLIACANRSNGLLTMASKFRFCEDVVRTKSLLESGTLGPVILYENTFTSRVDMSQRWNSDPRVSGGGVLIDNGTHSVDVFRYLLGPLASVQAVEGIRAQGLAVEDTVHIFGRSLHGTMASIDLSWSIHKPLDHFLALYGAQGTVQVGWKWSRYKTASSPDWVKMGEGYEKLAAFRAQIEDFRDSVGGACPRVSLAEALASVRVVDAAYRSLYSDSWVSVDDAENGS